MTENAWTDVATAGCGTDHIRANTVVGDFGVSRKATTKTTVTVLFEEDQGFPDIERSGLQSLDRTCHL